MKLVHLLLLSVVNATEAGAGLSADCGPSAPCACELTCMRKVDWSETTLEAYTAYQTA